MQKSLEQIQKENKKFILEAIHGCSYEEALEKELGVGCKVILEGSFGIENYDYTITDTDTFKISRDQIIKIIGKPLTLSRVLLALKDEEIGFYDNCLGEVWKGHIYDWDIKEDRPDRLYYFCDWDLTKETLEEQSEETQRKINKLFNN